MEEQDKNKVAKQEEAVDIKDPDQKLKNERDISSIDRQEGNLDHGETGGNFRESENREAKK